MGRVVYVKDVIDGIVVKIFDCKIWDVVGTRGFVAETFDDLFLRYFYFFIRASFDGVVCNVHSRFLCAA